MARGRSVGMVVLSLALLAGACGGPGPTAHDAEPVDPNAPEVVEPGDIPDDQVFIAVSPPGAAFSLKVPEGWARIDGSGTVTFTDHYNSITIAWSPTGQPPTVDSMRADGLADVSGDPSFTLVEVRPVTRRAGGGVVASYEIGSRRDAVTGKSALLSVERYVFAREGAQAVLTLAGAKGADNVDPWRTVTDSLTWR